MADHPTQAISADDTSVQVNERYASKALNRKLTGYPLGVFRGWEPSATGTLEVTLSPDSVFNDNVGVAEDSGGYVLNARTTGSVVLDFTGTTTWPVYVVYEATYTPPPGGTTSAILRSVDPSDVDTLLTHGAVTSGPFDQDEEVVGQISTARAYVSQVGSGQLYVVVTTGTFQNGETIIGQNSGASAALSAGPVAPTGYPKQVKVCRVNRVGVDPITVGDDVPTHRQEPYAYLGTTAGFMPGGAIEDLNAANLTTSEVQASRIGFNQPYTTLTNRLNAELTGGGSAGMAYRLATVPHMRPSLLYPVTPADRPGWTGTGLTANVSADFEDIPPSRYTQAGHGTITGTAFAVLELITGLSSGATGLVRVVGSTYVMLDAVSGDFEVGEIIQGGTGGGQATLTVIRREKGVGVSSPYDFCDVMDTDYSELVGSNGRIFGKVSVATATLTGTLTFYNGNKLVTGSSGTQFTSEINVGDIIEAENGAFYTVDFFGPGDPDENLTLVDDYAGTGGPITGSERRRFTLTFMERYSGSDQAISSPLTGQAIRYTFQQLFDADDQPPQADTSARRRNLAAGRPYVVEDGTTTTSGLALGVADVRVGAVKGAANGINPTPDTPKKRIDLIGTGLTTVSVDNTDPNSIKFTITSSPGTGGAEPIGPAGGSLGGSYPDPTVEAVGDTAGSHITASALLTAINTTLPNRDGVRTWSDSSFQSSPSTSPVVFNAGGGPGFTPRCVFCFGHPHGAGSQVGFGISTTTSTQFTVGCNAGKGLYQGFITSTGEFAIPGTNWPMTSCSSSGITLTRSGAFTGNLDIAVLAIGDNVS